MDVGLGSDQDDTVKTVMALLLIGYRWSGVILSWPCYSQNIDDQEQLITVMALLLVEYRWSGNRSRRISFLGMCPQTPGVIALMRSSATVDKTINIPYTLAISRKEVIT